MVGVDIIIAFLIALVLGLLMVPVLGPGRIGWPKFLSRFVLIFLMAWVAGVWFRPLGPTIYGTPWLVMLGTAGVFALLLALPVGVSQQHRPWHGGARARPRRVPHGEDTLPPGATVLAADSPEDAVAEVTFLSASLLFWALVAILLALVIGNYTYVGP